MYSTDCRTRSDYLLRQVVQSVVLNPTLLNEFGEPRKCGQRLSLIESNKALRFFCSNAHWMKRLSLSYLSDIAFLVRRNRNWNELAQKDFLSHPRDMDALFEIPSIIPHKTLRTTGVFYGRFEELCVNIPDQSVDLVVTSPPYAMQRADAYGGIAEDQYPDWTVKWMSAVRRILKPRGNVAIVIRPHVRDGHIGDYMLKTRLALRGDGWIERDEGIWLKPDAPPLGHTGMWRRSWESIHWFATDRNSYCNPHASGTFSARLGLSGTKGVGQHVHNVSETYRSGIARVSDVITVPVGTVDRSGYNTHPAQYPEGLVAKIIGLLSPNRGLVLDPFIGSGTTAVAAHNSGRYYLGYEKEQHYYQICHRRLRKLSARK